MTSPNYTDEVRSLYSVLVSEQRMLDEKIAAAEKALSEQREAVSRLWGAERKVEAAVLSVTRGEAMDADLFKFMSDYECRNDEMISAFLRGDVPWEKKAEEKAEETGDDFGGLLGEIEL